MEYISVEKVAGILNLSARTIRNYCANGKIKGAVKEGKTWLIPSDFEVSKKTKKKSTLDILLEEKNAKYENGLYHLVQVELAYNSNHIEGSTLTHDETLAIFNTNVLLFEKDTPVNINDITETANHFRAFDYILDNAKKKLTEKMIKEIHYLLKRGTSDERLAWFNVGDYKLVDNEVGGKNTSSVTDVPIHMKYLLNWYNSLEEVELEDIIEFHVRFESIHPFQDGNGRVGRLIMFKECLKHNIEPFIILDHLKMFYYRGLKEWKWDKAYLIDTCLTCQDKFIAESEKFKKR